MRRIRYIIARLRKMDFKNMKKLAKTVSARSGKPALFILLDMIWCGYRYEAGYTDYELFKMERTNAAQRRTFVTRGVNDRLVARFNDASYRHLFENKDEFNALFDAFLGRNWLRIAPPDEDGYDREAEIDKLRAFCEGKDEIVSKPRDGMCGKGVEILRTADFADVETLYAYLLDGGSGLLEEKIVQHPDMAALYPGSINTLRIVTINNGKAVTTVLALCRMGNGDNVDNFLHGGVVTRVDVETGKMLYDAVDQNNNTYDKHPITGTPFVGYPIPMWDACVALCEKAALVVPQVGYVGWDVAVTPDGPVLVEGNEFPGHCLYQLPPHTPDNYGLLPQFEKAIAAGRQ